VARRARPRLYSDRLAVVSLESGVEEEVCPFVDYVWYAVASMEVIVELQLHERLRLLRPGLGGHPVTKPDYSGGEGRGRAVVMPEARQ
jgi:hypothetical protein